MTDRELLQMALDALEAALSDDQPYISRSEETAEALRAALANEFNPDWNQVEALQESLREHMAEIQRLRAALAQPEQEIESDRPHVENDGCPTEKAVLQRFWREHQKQEPVRLQCVICGTVYADGVPPQVAQPKQKLWLWKNFVDGRPEYWAFDNPYPTNLDNGDPQTLGQPCGYAIFKPSRDGSCGRTEEQVLREMKSVIAPPQRESVYCGCGDEIVAGDGARCGTCVAVKYKEKEWQGLTDEEYEAIRYGRDENGEPYVDYELFDEGEYGMEVNIYIDNFYRAIEVKLKEKNG